MKKTFTKLSCLVSSLLASWMLLCSGDVSAQTYSNPTAITIPSSGTATPYPSTISVSGGPAAIGSLTVTLFGLSHTWPDDIDILLVGPNGDNLVLMSDAGGGGDIVAGDITFSGVAAAGTPDAGPLVAGTYLPTNVGAVDPFAAPFAGTISSPAPAGTATIASQFSGDAADGDWSLFVVDDAAGDLGQIAGGWSITFQAVIPGCTDPTACNYDPNANLNDGSCLGLLGCTNPLACNYNVNASCDNGSCCLGQCVTLTVGGGTFPGEIRFSFADPNGVVLASRTTASTSPFTGSFCFTGNLCGYSFTLTDSFGDGWNGGTYTFTDINGNVLASGTLANGAGPQVDILNFSGSEGCTDSNASNFDPGAICDDGSCLFCAAGSQVASFNMTDTGNNGWNGSTYVILDASGNIASQGSLNNASFGNNLSSGSNEFCLAPGCYTVSIVGGTATAEIGWNITDLSGNVVVSQNAPYAGLANNFGFTWAGATGCVIPGCTSPVCNNYNPFATEDDGSCLCPPDNDNCANAIAVTCNSSVTGTLQYSNEDPSATSCSGIEVSTPGVWYRLIGNGQQVTATTCASEFDTRLHVYSGSCGSLSCVASNDDDANCLGFASTVTFTAANGTQYFIFVSKFNAAVTENDFTLEISCQDCSNAPLNDNCASAFPAIDGVPVQASLCCANADDISSFNEFNTGYGVWYEVNSGSFDTFDFSIINGDAQGDDANDGTNVGLALFSGDCGSLTYIADCPIVPDQCGGSLYSIGEAITPNTDYYFLVYTTDAANCGNYTLTVSREMVGCTDPSATNYNAENTIDDGSCLYSAPPANDLCADAILIDCTTTEFQGTTGGSTNTGAPTACNIPADNGVWYLIVGDDQLHNLNTCGSAINSRIVVVSSDAGCGGTYTCVVSSDNDAVGCGFFDGNDAFVEFTATAGQLYYIYVTAVPFDTNGDGVNDLNEGAFTLNHNCAGVVLGCTDACACNYDPAANVDNGACDFLGCATCTDGNAYQLRMTDTAGNGWNGNTYTITDGLGNVLATGTLDDAQCVVDLDNAVGADSGFDVVCLPEGCYNMNVAGGTGLTQVGWSLVDANGVVVATDAAGGSFDFIIGAAVCGCNDPGACNFDPAATSNDGSCDYTTCAGCMDNTACNYDATATIPDAASCCYNTCLTLVMNDTFGDGWNGNTFVLSDANTGLVVATATLEDGNTETVKLCAEDGCFIITFGGGAFLGETSWILTGTNNGVISQAGALAGSIQVSVGSGNCTPGCLEPLACNYNESAGISDCTLCEYNSCQGCTYQNATNYTPGATIDDGSCNIVGSSTCPSDLDGNGIVNVSDLSLFLQDFGLICPN